MQYATLQKAAADKLPPFNLEAEHAILGAVLLDNSALFVAVDAGFHPDDFHRESHRTIFKAMLDINQRGNAIDLLTLRDELERTKRLEDIGGAAKLVGLVDAVPTAANIAYHIGIVREKARLRRLQNACVSVALKIYDDSNATSHEFLTQLSEELMALRTEAETPWALTSNGKPVAILQREYVRYLESIGFRATLYNRSLMFVHIEQDRIVKQVEEYKNICFTLKTKLKEIYEAQFPLLWELLLKERKFDYHIMTSLQVIDQRQYLTDDATHCHLFFKNGVVTISPTDGTYFRPYSEIEGYVWEEAISPHEYHGILTPEPAYDLNADKARGYSAEFRRFVEHVSNEFVDNHFVDNKTAFEHGIASLCWHYNDVLQQKAVIVIDNDPSYFSDGRRGKKILMDALRYVRSNGTPDGVVIKEDGKAFGGTFKFQRVKANTKILIIDDVDDESVNFKDFYSAITDGLVKEGKGMTRFAFSPETSPKMVFTTNRPFFGMDKSSTDRLLLLPMTDFFTREGQKPAQVFGHRLFYDWDSAEWARFHDYIIQIIFDAMQRDPLKLPEPDLYVFNANRLALELPEALTAYLDKLADDTDYDKESVINSLKELGFAYEKRGAFKQMLETYCRLRGRFLHKNTRDGRYKKGGVEFIRFVRSLWTETASSPEENQVFGQTETATDTRKTGKKA